MGGDLRTETEVSTRRHLDAVLAPRGYHLLHDCRWPGTGTATIDHVVIGPSGVWVVDDKWFSGRISVNASGELSTGKHPLASSIRKAGDQAKAVGQVLGGAPTQAILSIHDAEVPGGSLKRSGVVVAEAPVSTIDVIADSARCLRPAEIERLAAIARSDLTPRSAKAPTADPAMSMPAATRRSPTSSPWPVDRGTTVPNTIPPWMVRESTVPPLVIRPSHRGAKRAVVGVVLAALIAGALAYSYPRVRDFLPARTPTAPARPVAAGPAITVTYECRHPTTGWTQVVGWSDRAAAYTVLWATSPDGPWTPAVAFGDQAVRDHVVPGERSLVRVQRSSPGGETVESSAAGTAPATGC